jgi:drug/metabolite transporter (DMT)-like permease
MVFGQFPDQWTWFGSAIIFATVIYVVLRGNFGSFREDHRDIGS